MKDITIGQFVLVLMACSAHVVICSSLYGNETDRLSLLDFKNAVSLDPQQALMSWNDSAHFCTWEGVSCSLKNPRRVTSLNLTNRGLVGHISPSLGNLTFLSHLFLPTNTLNGQIPLSLGHLHHLESLYLSNNTLQGSIPDFANCSRLNIIEIEHNHLAGQIPRQINLPPLLQRLKLSFNNLTGTIPSSLSNITTLYGLGAVSNSIEGNVPYEIGKLPKLRYLDLGSNKLSGKFQLTLQNLSSLVGLNLAGNNLYGELPSTLGTFLPNLKVLFLAENNFEGHIPYSVVNASNLILLDMAYNKLSGVIPSSIGKLKKLNVLFLQGNQLQARDKQQWEFMDSLSNCTELSYLLLAENRLEGQIPNSLGNLSTQLQSLVLGQNQLSGNFPSGIADLLTLSSLELYGNHFTGAVPEWLGTLKELQGIDISDNIFTGSIPASLSNLSLLSELYLYSNRFEGHIPSGLGNFRVLGVLDMSNNNIYGNIPKEIFKIPTIWQLWLSFNNLDGPLPVEIGDCQSLVDIKLGRNVFSGSIPTSLGNITNLEALDLSHNNLTGTIPASLGNLQLLQQLDLSFNYLKGEVPTKGIFKNATAIQIDGNQALCGGPPELHLLTCSIMPWNSTKHKQSSIVLKVVTPLASMVSLAIVISFLFLWRGKQKRKSISLPSFDSKFPKVSYNDLARATDGFSTSKLIGRGRYSSVYQGALFQDRNVIAIKVFSLETRGAQKSFIAECNALRNVRHRNLVPILTACSSIDAKGNDFKALVYEFMPRGDLHALLYSTRDYENTSTSNHIALAQRLSIVVDVADALEYLHHNNQGTIVHCDLKPSNILLDDNMTAHVGDFGLARFKVDSAASSSFGDSNSTSSLAIKGTIGYVAPECAGGNQVSTASDVYSFGVVLLEILIRKRPTDDMFKDGLSIAKFTEINFPDKISQIADPQLLQEFEICQETPVASKKKSVQCLLSLLNIGLCCTKPTPSERISMQEVAAKLHGIRDAYLRED